MSLESRLETLLAASGSTMRLQPGGLGLAYSQRDGVHRLALSRIDVWPSDTEIGTVLKALAELGVDTAAVRPERYTHTQTGHQLGHTVNVVRLSWPVATQPRML
jgi:hypothetical protein